MGECGRILISIPSMVLALILSGCFVNEFNSAIKRMEIMPGVYMLLCWAMNDKL